MLMLLRSLQIFHALNVPTDKFTCVNILEDDSLRSGLKEYSQVPLSASRTHLA